MKYKKYLSGVLAAALVLNTGAISVLAAGVDKVVKKTAQTQTSSTPETVYVNYYDGSERSVSFNEHWKFHLGELNGAETVAYNDSSWDSVTLPHDYSIDQGFTTAAPAEQESGYVLGGTGWYRKNFTLDESTRGKTISIDFDGVYMNATVYLNGEMLGTHPYGYTPFSFVLPQDKLKFGAEENVITVKVEHKLPSSRWYSGSGIYRDVNLTVTDPVHVADHGTAVTTPDIEKGKGTVKVVTEVQNNGNETSEVSVKQKVYKKGSDDVVAEGKKTAAKTVAAGETVKIEDSVTVADPELWDTKNSNLYTVRTEVYVGDVLKDSYDSDFGFRWVEFTQDNGFFLNGKNIKLHGVSMHHDQGALGSEAWERAVERQVQELKQMGVNAIRVTHNPASQVLIDVCNRKGMMLIEEAFDCWLSGKDGNTEDYGKWFYQGIESGNQIVNGSAGEKWAEFDIKAMVRRGRNNPSIIMWSLGNEIFQSIISWDDIWQYPDVAKNLITWIGQEDSDRYVTFGDNQVKNNVWADNAQVNTAAVIADAAKYGVKGGVVGFNYGGYSQIESGHNRGWLVYGSETASSVNSRGVYDRKNNCSDNGSGDKRLTSYDQSAVSWGHWASDGLWITMRQNYNAGEFVWTGFDYIGEPTPDNWTGTGSNGTWPNVAKNSYFGIIDTAGIPKDSYYLYQSQWNEEKNTLHVLPVWNEDEIMIDGSGEVEVVVYSDAPVVKLYLNGEEVGSATATRTNTPTGGYQNYTSGTGCFDGGKASGHTSLYATFQVPYEAGKLEAKAFKEDGVTEITDTDGRDVVETTGKATKLTANADRSEITADGKDLSYVEIDVTDKDGKEVNGAEPEISVSVEGDGKLLALDNGLQNDTTSYSEPTRKAGKGKLMAIVQSTNDAGSFTVKATADGYTAAETTVTTVADGSIVGDKTVVSYKISKNYYVKKGTKPVLPEEVKINYSDNTSETRKVTWDAFTGEEENYSVAGLVDGINLKVSVNVTAIGQTAGVLNYSAAVGKDAQITLPATRPAVLADGTILAAEFPVTWDVPSDLTVTAGTKVLKGTAKVFDQTFEVTATIRVSDGEYKDGAEVMGNVPEMYNNGISSKEDEAVADILDKLQDDKTSALNVAFSGKGTLDFRLDTAVELKDFTMYLKDTAPTSDTIKVYASGDNGVTFTPVACKVSNKKEKGVTVRTYTAAETVSETYFRIEFTKDTALTELKFNTRIPTFTIGSEAALSSLKVGGYTADAATLAKGWFGISKTEFTAADVIAEGKDNASVTILEKDANNVLRILIESEDHSMRAVYSIMLGADNSKSDDASDDSMDYDYSNMTITAPSEEGSGSAANAADGKTGTIWHSNWGKGSGPEDLRNDADNRYLQLALKDVETINGLRYIPRSSQKNGIVTKYSVKVSTDGENWSEVSTGDWNTSVEWKLAAFTQAVQAKYIRLYGVETSADNSSEYNKYMSAAEVRVRYAANELCADNTTVTLENESADYTGSAIEPKPVVAYKASEDAQAVTLTEGTDYELSYKNNTQPGTATVTVTGKGKYQGAVEKDFTITEADVTITGYEEVAVETAVNTYPALPGTVIAYSNTGDQVLEVEWDEISAEKLAKTGTFTVDGTVVDTKARITATVTVSTVVSRDNIVYFVDVGASEFTTKGQEAVEANAGTIKNTVPDQAYSEESGWGYTNSSTDLEVNGSGDAYTTIRNFKSGKNGKTLTYKFALEAGSYDIIAGYYDPWAEWAGDDRHAKVSVTTEDGTELASEADHHISETASVTFENITLDAAGNINLNTIPLKSGSDNCDVMISYIVIVRKSTPAGPDEPVADEEKKVALKTAITLAENLTAANYTAESYAELTEALNAAKEVYKSESATESQIKAQITALMDAIKALEGVGKADNDKLQEQLSEKEAQLSEKERQLEAEKANVTTLTEQLNKAQDDLKKLTDASEEEKAALQAQINNLKKQLDDANAEVSELETEKNNLETETANLRAVLKQIKDQEESNKAAIKKAQEEAQKARKEIAKLKDSMTLKNGDTVTADGVQYRVTDAAAKTAEAYGTAKKNIKTINVAATVTIKDMTCKVTAVADQAFAGQKKATRAVIGANVTKIGKKAFYGDSRLKSITVKGKKLKTVGKQALKGINKHAVVRVPKAKKKAYKALFKGKGQKKSVKVK